MPAPDRRLEEAYSRDLGLGRQATCAGVDEAGRGAWAGPVFAAAVVLEPRRAYATAGIDDSKRLTPARREALAAWIRENARTFAVAQASVEEIEELNILQASLLAMRRALGHLDPAPACALIDGNRTPEFSACPERAVIGGDGLSLCIAAASILAKVERDHELERLGAEYPGYGFERHRGYGTAAHAKALAQLGVCPAHRRTFAPIRAALSA